MEVTEQLKKFLEFFNSYYQADLLEKVRKGDKFLNVDFANLSIFDPELANLVLDNPEELIKAAEISIEQLELPGDVKGFKIRFENLPESQHMMIREIRSKHLGKFLWFDGIVRQKSDVRPQVTTARFECPSCGNVISVIQVDGQFREPSRCSCGRHGKFRLLSKELVDAQGLVLEEAPENLEGGEQPKRMNVFLKDDLVSPISEKRTNPGSKITIIGLVKEEPIILRSGAKSTRFDLLIEANNVKASEESFLDIAISNEEEQEILKLANDVKVYDKIINSIAPSIFGYDKIKEALALQLFGGVQKKRKDGAITRGDFHILLVGDPGGGKSQLLKRINVVAPKGRYISGKGISAAGLTASVVRDEFLKGWSLEAGAMVLASNGICCIDEMDKMSSEDTAAMHEALENQSYHPDTEIMLSDGSVYRIGDFVDNLIEKKRDKIIFGKKCEILPVSNIELLTTDFSRIYPTKAKMVSRHIAPDNFIKITYSNGRSITVTPEHPVFVYNKGQFMDIPAKEITTYYLAPSPRNLPTKSKMLKLAEGSLDHHNNKKVDFPSYVTGKLARLLGYIITEGHSYQSQKNRYAEIGVSNTDSVLIDDVSRLFKYTFKTYTNINKQPSIRRVKATKDLMTVRLSSKPVYRYMVSNFRGCTCKAKHKYIDNVLRRAPKDAQLEFLKAAFRGDGFVDSTRFGFSTVSPELAKGYQDLLLQNSIASRIDKEKRKNAVYFKVSIVGRECFKLFIDKIAEKNDRRLSKLIKFYLRSIQKRNERDIIPREVIIELNSLLLAFKVSDGYFDSNIKRGFNAHKDVVLDYVYKIKNKLKESNRIINSNDSRRIRRSLNITVSSLSKPLNISPATIYNIENNKDYRYSNLVSTVKKIGRQKIESAQSKIDAMLKLINSKLKFVYIKKVEKIKNNNIKWVYDVTVEPTRTFISEGLVLHNTVSISKANIQATLIAQTTVLAAANPKYGRFNPYEILAKQIDMPPALINRFDLIFPIKDVPNEVKDEMLAKHILNLHQTPDMGEPDIPTKFLRKYIAYAKQKCKPKLTDSAMEEIQRYYIHMRNATGAEEGALRAIPISPRQLEALVRLSEASAKVRLSEKVTKKDAQRATDLLHFCLSEVGVDPETGKIDIDLIATGVTASQRTHIMDIKEIITDLENRLGKQIPIDDVIKEATARGIEEDKVEEVIEKLKRSGDIFEPRRGLIQKL